MFVLRAICEEVVPASSFPFPVKSTQPQGHDNQIATQHHHKTHTESGQGNQRQNFDRPGIRIPRPKQYKVTNAQSAPDASGQKALKAGGQRDPADSGVVTARSSRFKIPRTAGLLSQVSSSTRISS